MARPKLKLAWIEDRKKRNIACQKRMKGLMKMAEELTILSDTKACLTFFNRDEGKLVAWPSQEEAESLIERFYALPENQRNMNADDQESYIKTITKKIEKKLEHSRKMVAWPSQEEAKSLIDRFNALPEIERYENAYDPESYIKTKIKKIEKRLEHSRKVVQELEMDHLMLQIQIVG
ncbi:hypothetical protein Bca52824_094601 [Brassica carinata]|uniref:MADS-box domain-containing protein n=1 Tax=Brassica carinata TaxID=52824 RepID=A0A8X7P3A9_BRACI|nr:hypothetical protein Bca52824_094601 [Brassica carinata]